MKNGDTPHTLAPQIATVLLDGFDQHYQTMRVYGRKAKTWFENARWLEIQQAVRERIRSYDNRVAETVTRLREEFNANHLDDTSWQAIKLHYIGKLVNHKQPELAETFFNSVTTRILHRNYFHNDFIFARPAVSTEYIESSPPTYASYYPASQGGLKITLRKMLHDIHWQQPFAHLEKDIHCVLQAVKKHLGGWPQAEANLQIQILRSPFYRNKGAYLIGKAINGHVEIPFAVPVLQTRNGQLYLDTILLDAWRIGLLFSLSRAYFMVDMEVPSAYIQFLRSILPNKPRSELYTMLGLGKQGKTLFLRDFLQHLQHSADQFVIAPGIKGLVMLVFTLPSYPYVFKIIKDIFGTTKETDRATVKHKYQLVKQVDRVGRMADTLEFSQVALPRHRFSAELLQELKTLAPSMIEEENENIVIKHLYIERRMTPLNLYLETANDLQIEAAVREYGNAIRELALANIFPGDMLWKNFGMTRYNRVVFYDYDEIEYMTDCNFRTLPNAPDDNTEMSGEIWYPVAPNDIFPEEFATFLLSTPKIRQAFIRHHADLLEASFWQKTQHAIRSGQLQDFFPYEEKLRFCHKTRKHPPQKGGISPEHPAS